MRLMPGIVLSAVVSASAEALSCAHHCHASLEAGCTDHPLILINQATHYCGVHARQRGFGSLLIIFI